MLAAEIVGERRVKVTERAEPQASGDIVKVKTLVVPMCTEWQNWRRGVPSRELGHEAVGVVVDAASSARVTAGDRVVVMPHAACGHCPACRAGNYIHCTAQRNIKEETGSSSGYGCYADYLLKPDYLLFKVPTDIELRHVAMAICGLGPTFTALNRMGLTATDTLLVSGCGAVGLGGIINARTIGARVIALEFQPYRAELARSLGAEEVLDPRAPDLVEQIRELTGGYGADAALETSNNEAAPPILIEATRPRGRVAFVSWSGAVPVNRIVGRGLDLFGCWHWNHETHGDEMIGRVRAAGPLLDKLVTHSFALAEVERAFALQETGNCGKILLFPGSEGGVQ